ncbi:MAG: carbohydrate binding domain-containing protein [Thermoguttaceae bacterium]|jgi:hypothetical protein
MNKIKCVVQVNRSLFVAAAGWILAAWAVPATDAAENLFGNPSFENGRDQWHLACSGKTAARFTVDEKEAAAGQRSALIRMGAVDGWGVQFGQTMEAPDAGRTYTFAVLAKSVKGPVALRLEIERRSDSYDRAASCPPQTIMKDKWTELHVTFKIDKPFPQGWFSYVSCNQRDAEFRLDMFRLVEGDYVPYEKAAREETAAAAVTLFDSVQASPVPLAGQTILGRKGWVQVPEDATDHHFRGDAVLVNDRLALVLRRGAPGAELHGLGTAGPVLRAVLAPTNDEPAAKLQAVAVVANDPSQAAVDATFQSPGGRKFTIRYDLAMGQTFIKTEPREGARGLSVGAPCRFLVLPDFFADDIVIDAAEIPMASAEVPSENFLLHLLPDRQAVVMAVASNRGEDAAIDLSGQERGRLVRSSRMVYGKGGKIWVAILQAPEVWHQRDVTKEDAGKVLALDWTAPFSAQWRVDWRFRGRLTASWEMAAQMKSGEFLKYGWFGSPGTLPADRQRWTTVLGSFLYPCWLDQARRGHLQSLTKPDRFEGPAVIYPIQRTKDTPLREFTVVDIVRATLGVGPCEYILDVEGQGATMKGRATCATRDALGAIYSAKQQKGRRADIERILEEVVIFVKHIRGRIEQYVDFGHETLAYLEQQKKAHPELSGVLADLEASARAIDAAFARHKAAIKTPQYVVDLTETFRETLLDYEGEDALKKCTAITHAIVDVGGNQDELVGECRNAVKILRQRAALALATDPRAAEVAREIRDRTQKALRNATSYEAPRH